MQNIRLPAIRQILVTCLNVIAGAFTVVLGAGTVRFGIAATDQPPPCTAGYGTTNKRSPADTFLRTPNLNADCAAPLSSAMTLRGAERPAARWGLGDYNPKRGHVITSNERRLTIGLPALNQFSAATPGSCCYSAR